jgi:non-specific serine/threonine protein kinase/serine/threonine-protein kinase
VSYTQVVLKQVLERSRATLDADHYITLDCLNNMGTHYMHRGRPEEALPYLQQVLDRQRGKREPDHPNVLTTIHNLGVCYRDAQRYAEAEPFLLQAVEGTKRKLGFAHPLTQTAVQNLSELHKRQGKPQLSEPRLREIAEFHRNHSGPDSQAYDSQLAFLFRNLMEQKKFAEAEQIARERLAIRVKTTPDSWALYFMKSLLAEALLPQKKYAEAEPLLLEAYEGMTRSTPGAGTRQNARSAENRLTETVQRLIALYQATGKPEEAEKWKREVEVEKRRASDASP